MHASKLRSVHHENVMVWKRHKMGASDGNAATAAHDDEGHSKPTSPPSSSVITSNSPYFGLGA